MWRHRRTTFLEQHPQHDGHQQRHQSTAAAGPRCGGRCFTGSYKGRARGSRDDADRGGSRFAAFGCAAGFTDPAGKAAGTSQRIHQSGGETGNCRSAEQAVACQRCPGSITESQCAAGSRRKRRATGATRRGGAGPGRGQSQCKAYSGNNASGSFGPERPRCRRRSENSGEGIRSLERAEGWRLGAESGRSKLAKKPGTLPTSAPEAGYCGLKAHSAKAGNAPGSAAATAGAAGG